MSIELPVNFEERLQRLAATQGRDVSALVEEAVRQYLDAAAITDVAPGAVADAQAALLAELPNLSDWEAGEA